MTAHAHTGALRRRWRAVDGIVLLDKPAGLSSTQALQRVRRLLQAEKAGHAGTLDPMATGMLPLCFGQATKACGQLLGKRKAYRATVQLGASTDTGDAEGHILARAAGAGVHAARTSNARMQELRGARTQVPPMYSALKREGRPLYELARQGVSVEREARAITIERLELIARRAPIRSRSTSSAPRAPISGCSRRNSRRGLGTLGHLSALRRLWVEPFAADAHGHAGADRGLARRPAADRCDRRACRARLAAAGRPGLSGPAGAAPRCVRTRCTCARAGCWRRPTSVCAAPHVRVYDEQGSFLGLVEVTADRQVRVQRLFVAGAGTAI